MKKLVLAAVLVPALAIVSVHGVAAQEERPTYWSLVQEAGSTSSGRLIVRIPPARIAPSDWDVDWYVSMYTEGGLRLPMGYVQDKGAAGAANQLILDLPSGPYTIEITRLPSSIGRVGLFDIEKGKWLSAYEIVFVGKVDVSVQADHIHIVSITYRNPQVTSKKEGSTTTRVYAWDSLALVPSEGQDSDLPQKAPKPYPLMQGLSLDALDQSRVVAGLRSREAAAFAEVALLHAQRLQIEPILAGLIDKSIPLNWRVGQVLVNARDARSVAVLAGLLQEQNGDPAVRRVAAWALGELGDTRGLDALKAALRDRDTMVRNYSALALGQIKAPGVVPVLVEATRDTMEVAGGKIFITARLDSPDIYYAPPRGPGLLTIMPIPYFAVRMNAIYGLGQVGDPAAVDPLVGFLSDRDEQVRLVALQSLGNYDGPKVVEALMSRLSDQQPVRFIALHLLAKRGDTSALDLIDKLAREDPDVVVREAATAAATRIRKRLQQPDAAQK